MVLLQRIFFFFNRCLIVANVISLFISPYYFLTVMNFILVFRIQFCSSVFLDSVDIKVLLLMLSFSDRNGVSALNLILSELAWSNSAVGLKEKHFHYLILV